VTSDGIVLIMFIAAILFYKRYEKQTRKYISLNLVVDNMIAFGKLHCSRGKYPVKPGSYEHTLVLNSFLISTKTKERN
jgi:hypothetical protein